MPKSALLFSFSLRRAEKLILCDRRVQRIPSTSAMHGDAVIHVSYLYKLSGDMDSALKWMDNAIEKSPKSAFFMFSKRLC